MVFENAWAVALAAEAERVAAFAAMAREPVEGVQGATLWVAAFDFGVGGVLVRCVGNG